MTIHARTRAEGYKPPAHWEYIAQMKELVGDIPVFANGDIWSVNDYFKCRQISNCDDVALGRGVMARPDLALQIKSACALSSYSAMSWNQIQKILLPDFFDLSQKFRSDQYAITRTKQWTKLLSRTYQESASMFDAIKVLQNCADVKKALTIDAQSV